ncbi:hypothetical protein BD413DRAFT_612022 [Trametes elegans]|nr:hypothetical protein BD413DRAFT_612022 [Trametes elegans]
MADPESLPPSWILRLPDEILVAIFDFVHAAIFYPTLRGSVRDWLRFLHVCSHWRCVALSVSQYWHIVPVGRDPAQVDFFLSKSRGLLTDVCFNSDSIPPPLEALQPHISSIRRLEFSAPYFDCKYSAFNRLLSTLLPCLEELCIWPIILNIETLHRMRLSLHRYPCLWGLRLQHLVCPPDISELRVLDLRSCYWVLSLGGFIDKLATCSNLVELRLNRSMSWFSPDDEPGDFLSQPTAVLRHLHTLEIVDQSSEAVASLLAYLEMPALRDVRLVHRPDKPAGREDTEYTIRDMLPSNPSRVLPDFSSSLVTATVSVLHNISSIVLRSGTHCAALSVATSFERDCGHALPAVLEDLVECVPDAPARLTTLAVHGDSYHVPAALWRRLFGRCAHLSALELSGNGTWTALWHALRPVASSWAVEPCVPCPALASVRVRYVPRPEDNYPAPPDMKDVEAIQGALEGRRNLGAQLQELVWEAHSAKHADFEEARERFLSSVRSYAERAAYNDLG